jgi:8-oxo-dGTP diphosphatase
MEVYKATGETETFRFIEWDRFGESELTLPIDKVVAEIVRGRRPRS